MALSILLTKLGVKCAILENNNAFSAHPQAHFINNRYMEILIRLRVLSLLHTSPSTSSPEYCLSTLRNLISIWFNSEKCEHGSIGEREIFMGHECIAINGAEHGVTVAASFLSKGKYVTRDIQCHFLVGTDGTGSSVRKSLGISMRGEKDLQKLVSVHFLSQELGQYLVNERPGMMFFIFNKDAIGVLIAHDLKQGKFVLQVPFYPPQQKLENFSSEMCKRWCSNWSA